MDQKTLHRLERELEEAIADVTVHRLGLKHLPFMPSRFTMQMMAKAAAAVYEAVEENHQQSPRSPVS
jgi:hypothetical protein